MFNSKYSKLLTILLIIGIVLIIGALILAFFMIERNKRLEQDAIDAVEQFQGQVSKK